MEPKALTVTQLTGLVKSQLEGQFQDLYVEGEISNFRPSSTGHYYFSLKDREAVLQAVMFRNRLGSLKFLPADGQLVRVRGSLSVYAARGSYQIICETMEQAGRGDILAMLEERKRRLAALGWFDAGRKRPLPPFPRRIGVVTSPTGAALRDILQVTRRRNPGMDILVLPAPVQGNDAPPLLAAQIRRAALFSDLEVLIVGRGGGSLEDLLPFSDEEVVRAVAESPIPVISAVGHEIDTSLSDYAADVAAPTPSAAAELVCPPRREILLRLDTLKSQMGREIRNRTDRVRLLMNQFRPQEMRRLLAPRLQDSLLRLDEARDLLERKMADLMTRKSHRVEVLKSVLEAGAPSTVLRRGYALIRRDDDGSLITRPGQTRRGEKLTVEMAGGKIRTVVEDTENEEL